MRALKISLLVIILSTTLFAQEEFINTTILKTKSDSNFTILGHWTDGIAYDMYTQGNLVYVVGQGLRILDISNLPTVEEIGYFNCGNSHAVFKDEEYVFVGQSFYGLRIIDTNDPSNLFQVGMVPIGAIIKDINTVGDVAFICTWDNGLMILDISDKSNPTLLSSMPLEVAPAMDLSIQGNYAYVACRENGLRIVDITDPSNPDVVGFYNLGPWIDCMGVDVQGIYCYLGYGDEGFKVMDISNPASPINIATGWFWASPKKVDVKNEFAYVSCDEEIIIVDISSPNNPTELGSLFTSNYIIKIRFQDYKLFVADGDGGVYILKNDLISNIDETTYDKTPFSLSQNYPNPFNPVTSMQYTISSRQFVTLKVYDLLGREVATIVNEDKPAGEYEVEFNAANLLPKGSLTSGIYFYQLKAGEFIETRKMVLLK